MSRQEKKDYLILYRLQQPKIDSAKNLMRNDISHYDTYINILKNAETLRRKIEEEIGSVDENILREILFSKYILGMSLESIAESLNYSKRQIERLHSKALEKFNMQ